LKAPTSAELTRLAHTIARRVGRFLERKGWLTRDVEDCYLVGEGLVAGPMDQLLGFSITYRIAVGPQQGRKVFTLQRLPACDEPYDNGVGKVAGASGGTREARAAVPLHQPPGETALAHPERQRPLRSEGIHECRGRRDAQERPS
jgi:hypothetical protein